MVYGIPLFHFSTQDFGDLWGPPLVKSWSCKILPHISIAISTNRLWFIWCPPFFCGKLQIVDWWWECHNSTFRAGVHKVQGTTYFGYILAMFGFVATIGLYMCLQGPTNLTPCFIHFWIVWVREPNISKRSSVLLRRDYWDWTGSKFSINNLYVTDWWYFMIP